MFIVFYIASYIFEVNFGELGIRIPFKPIRETHLAFHKNFQRTMEFLWKEK